MERRLRLHLLLYFGGRRMASITVADVLGFVAQRQVDRMIVRKARAEGTEACPP